MKTQEQNTRKIILNKILYKGTKKVLVQIGRDFFELRLYKTLQEENLFKELKEMLENNKYKLELLKEDEN